MHVLDFKHTHENYRFRHKTNTQRPQPPGASWHSYRMPGQRGGYHTGNPGCHRNPLWSDKSSQGRAAITASLPATGCFWPSRMVLRSNRLTVIFPIRQHHYCQCCPLQHPNCLQPWDEHL